MSNYLRAYLHGGIYFFTVVTFNRAPVFTDENRVEALRQAFRKVKADYIHYNPVKHGLANSPSEWAWSSFDNAVRKGWYEPTRGDHEPANIVGMDCE